MHGQLLGPFPAGLDQAGAVASIAQYIGQRHGEGGDIAWGHEQRLPTGTGRVAITSQI